MSPSSHNHVVSRDSQINVSPPRLKIGKSSHFPMKKPSHSATSSSMSPSPSASSASSSPSPPQSSISSPSMTAGTCGSKGVSRPPQAPQQPPVIIYTHSPKVIHTHPRDFMSLVQKLTGLYRPDGEDQHVEQKSPTRIKPDGLKHDQELNKNGTVNLHDGIESSSVTTDEKISSGDHNRVQLMNPNNPHFIPQISYESPNPPYMNGFSRFDPSSTDFVYTNQPSFYTSYGDRLLFTQQDEQTQFHPTSTIWR